MLGTGRPCGGLRNSGVKRGIFYLNSRMQKDHRRGIRRVAKLVDLFQNRLLRQHTMSCGILRLLVITIQKHLVE